MMRSAVKLIVLIALVAVACWNIGVSTCFILRLPPREVNEVEAWQKEWEPIQTRLIREGYGIGDVGYITARSLRGEEPSEREIVERTLLYYAAIPLNLVRNKMNSPFILANFKDEKPIHMPPGLAVVYDSGHGLVLFKTTQ